MKRVHSMKHSKKISRESGFTLLEILASSFVILVVAAVTSQLLMHPKKEMKFIQQKMALKDYVDNEFRLLNESSLPLPTVAYTKFSACNTGVSSCTTNCGIHATECAAALAIGVSCAGANSFTSCIDGALDSLIQSGQACFVSFTFDPTVDENPVSPTTPPDATKATQMVGVAKLYRPDESEPEVYALPAFFFRR